MKIYVIVLEHFRGHVIDIPMYFTDLEEAKKAQKEYDLSRMVATIYVVEAAPQNQRKATKRPKKDKSNG